VEAPRPELAFNTWPVDGEVHLSWEAMPEATSYTLYWSTEPDVASERPHKIEGIEATRYIHRGLRNGSVYYYQLVGV
ncbi:MAG: hypothetical protein GWO16_02400, partial [Gammaproteobacteria bacterium]|nr:hypothetical protein [Gammaproteobacteria bacterium]NIR96999.1 hypothetical protein [Gammaproteobacteria bacterium]NIT62701.1 hypothetical protein [Gammaproteobacteria bacterium]NIV19659.1 hypothetical protein [Gammaproteobacteria bacterium]NIX10879.1 hypothetical protein [Gammaproteobacteria bacterium]